MKKLLAFLSLTCLTALVRADDIGSVNTSWKMLGPDNKIVVESIDDPDIHGITCYLARAKTGGISGAVGIAENKTEASLSCLKIGPITQSGPLPRQQDIAKIRASLFFKKLHLVRMIDPAHSVVIYLTYSDELIEGSPKNSISAVPLGIPLQIK
ncbi:CreA family protein [Ferrovum sp.]|jgi:CreA protein|uniref:CreA family protein n=1 Tax=Ferrovum sp. TaxID=2609467 RepID=UPI0026176B4E|nr:CreA family protein [Ferrovum sp.]